MNVRAGLFLGLCGASLSILAPTSGRAQQADPHSAVQRNLPLVFAVWPAKTGPDYSHAPDSPLLDPIAVIDAGKFHNISGFNSQNEKESDAAEERFQMNYYRAGFPLMLFIHGAAAGTAKVVEPVGVSCISSTATAALSTPLSGGELGLAVSGWEHPVLHPDRDRPVTLANKIRFRDAAIGFLTGKGVPGPDASGVQVSGVRSIFLGRELPNVFVGSAFLKQKTAIYGMFFVMNDDRKKMEVARSSYHRATDVEDGTDSKDETYVSHLDLDGDGIDEIITTSYYYESWDYTIYRLQNGSWKAVYSGSGGGC
ncbi:MAG: hypothetical protein WCC21_05405 [Candidatus Acidiferrales bacterium]